MPVGRQVGRALAAAAMRRHRLRTAARWAARRDRLPRALWQRLPAADEFAVSVPGGGSFLWRPGGHDSVGRQLYWRGLGDAEGATLRPWCDLAAAAGLVIDVGANTGLYSLAACAANPGCRVIAFEPVAESAQRLRAHADLNGFGDRIEVREVAVADENGTATFHVPEGPTPGSASLHQKGFRGQSGRLVHVPVATLDAALGDELRRVELVKLDVEGFEDAALAGMPRLLAEAGPPVVVECNPDGPYERVNDILTAAGYRFFHLLENGPVPVECIRPDRTERYRNFLAAAER